MTKWVLLETQIIGEYKTKKQAETVLNNEIRLNDAGDYRIEKVEE